MNWVLSYSPGHKTGCVRSTLSSRGSGNIQDQRCIGPAGTHKLWRQVAQMPMTSTAKSSPPSGPAPSAPWKVISWPRKNKIQARLTNGSAQHSDITWKEQLQHQRPTWEWPWRSIVKGNLPKGAEHRMSYLVICPRSMDLYCFMCNDYLLDGQKKELWRKGMWMDLSKQVRIKTTPTPPVQLDNLALGPDCILSRQDFLEKWDGDVPKKTEGRGWHKRVMSLLILNNTLVLGFLIDSLVQRLWSARIMTKEKAPHPPYHSTCSTSHLLSQCNSLGSMICKLLFPFWLACFLPLKLSPH